MKTEENTILEDIPSTCFDKMEPLKPWPEVVRLGKQIAHELGLGRSNDTLTRWMAHRVAELIELAENAPENDKREKARSECTDLILRLWERRSAWPQGQPLSYILPFLRTLTEEPQPRFHWKEPDGTWIGMLPKLERLHEREWRICADAAIADIPLEEAKEERHWLTEHPDELSPEELEVLQRTIKLIERVYADTFALDTIAVPKFAELPAEERTRHLHEVLAKIASERHKLITATASSDDIYMNPAERDESDEEQEDTDEVKDAIQVPSKE